MATGVRAGRLAVEQLGRWPVAHSRPGPGTGALWRWPHCQRLQYSAVQYSTAQHTRHWDTVRTGGGALVGGCMRMACSRNSSLSRCLAVLLFGEHARYGTGVTVPCCCMHCARALLVCCTVAVYYVEAEAHQIASVPHSAPPRDHLHSFLLSSALPCRCSTLTLTPLNDPSVHRPDRALRFHAFCCAVPCCRVLCWTRWTYSTVSEPLHVSKVNIGWQVLNLDCSSMLAASPPASSLPAAAARNEGPCHAVVSPVKQCHRETHCTCTV